jgi:Putative beta-barrel porin-2, OmpL-like. bbp2
VLRPFFGLLAGFALLVLMQQQAFAQTQPAPTGSGTEQTAPAPAEKKKERSDYFVKRLWDAYVEELTGTEEGGPEPPRRAMPSPLDSPPFPVSDYQGYPLIGAPYGGKVWPLQKALEGTVLGDFLNKYRLYAYGWIDASGNWSTSAKSNMPTSYWLVPNVPLLDQLVFRVERPVDSVQTDHIDVGFRSTFVFGSDYRYITAGGWTSDQLLKHNKLYGYDFTEQYIDVYIPWIAQGTEIRVGRWIATPDIETQFAPDNFLGSHSILFTFDTYTQTGFMVSHQLNKQWMFQWGLHAGTDMAPWYKGAVPTGFLGVRWVGDGNNDSVYLVLNSINDAKFQRFKEDGQPAGHDNFNYLVGTYQHRFTPRIYTATESYFMWQRDAVVGGTPSIGPVRSFGGGGGIGKDLPGVSYTYGVLNYTMYGISKRDYFTLRNEVWRDERGERSGFASTYSSHTIGWSHQFSDSIIIRPEIGYYHSYNAKAFDLGRRNYDWIGGIDTILRF